MASSNSVRTGQSDRRYIAATMRAPLLEREVEANLARRWLEDRDEKALHELIEAHGRLVVRIAVGFKGSGLPVADLVQEGNIGLMEAAERFDPERNVRFSTYATWWIVAGIQNYILRNSSIVRAATTPKQRRLFFNLRRLRARHAARFDGRLSADDREMIAERLGATVVEIERMEAHIARSDQSLNTPIGDDDGIEQIDLLADFSPNPEDIETSASGRRARSDWIDKALDRLSTREREIIAQRFLAERRITLAEIGKNFGVSKERVRQIEGRALQKMHATLNEFIDRPDELFDN
ncbi:MAG: RNA polymerase factor sigma-32 [Alphaproteobacteria bacterium]|nr:RNA polymerase factor sigma-32 [Alphaproteobacteria bacterium]